MRYFEETVGPIEKCQELFPYIDGKYHLCVLSFNCGGSPWKGDSGSPLIKPSKLIHGPVSIGVLSTCAERCKKGLPVVYTRITPYLKWIRDNSGIAHF